MRNSLRWQSRPSQPSGQTHWKELMPSMQVPPFLQGVLTQSLISAGAKEARTFNAPQQTWAADAQAAEVELSLLSWQ